MKKCQGYIQVTFDLAFKRYFYVFTELLQDQKKVRILIEL